MPRQHREEGQGWGLNPGLPEARLCARRRPLQAETEGSGSPRCLPTSLPLTA